MLVAFSVAPSGSRDDGTGIADNGPHGDSVSAAVAAAVAIVRASGLPHRTDSMFTTIEGDWDECMAVVKAATNAAAEFGTRVSLVLKADIRPGYSGEMHGKLERLEAAIGSTGASTALPGDPGTAR